MIPLLTAVVSAILPRIFNKKEIKSQTNVSTAVAVTTAPASLFLLMQSEDPILQVAGGVGIILGAVLTFYKDKADE